MENLIDDICTKTGIDRATAQKVVGYMKANVTRITQLLRGGDGDAVLGGTASNIASRAGDASRR